MYIIAEACCNHIGNMLLAYYMIRTAKAVGADAIKFQMYVVDKVNDPSLHNFLRSSQFTEQQHKELYCACKEVGIDYICSAFDVESLDILKKMGVKIKIPSGQIHNKEYLKEAAVFGVILSTGMTTLQQVGDAVKILGKPAVLHCNTAYPTPDEDANLNCITTLKKEFPDLAVGLSDHTTGSAAAIAATALGAEIIEKHFILSREIRTPDTSVSLEPSELKDFIQNIRRTEALMGGFEKTPTNSETVNLFRRDFGKERNGNERKDSKEN